MAASALQAVCFADTSTIALALVLGVIVAQLLELLVLFDRGAHAFEEQLRRDRIQSLRGVRKCLMVLQ